MQQHPAMGRGIRADAVEANQIIVFQPLGHAFTRGKDRAVIEHAAGRLDDGGRAKAELCPLAQALFAIVEQRLGGGKAAAAGLSDECRHHPASRGPAGVDRQHGFDEIFVE
jgi:hypothetical protein